MRFFPRRMAAVAVAGDFAIADMDADYILTVSNGSNTTGINPFEEDDNKQKAYNGRLRLSPIEDMTIGASFYTDKLTELDTLGNDTEKRTGIVSIGAQLEWHPNNFGLELEYVHGSIDPSDKAAELSNGYMSMISYRFIDRYTPYLRYEYLDPNSTMNDDYAQLIIYGLNIKISNYLFIKAEMNNTKAGSNNIRFKGNGFNEFKAAVAIGF